MLQDGFYDGELMDGRRGLVPSNFVQKVPGLYSMPIILGQVKFSLIAVATDAPRMRREAASTLSLPLSCVASAGVIVTVRL